MGSRERRSTACLMLVMAYSGGDRRGFSAPCPSRAESFDILFGTSSQRMSPSMRPERDRHPVRLPLSSTGSGLAAWWGGDTLSQMAVLSTTHKIYNTRRT